SHALALEDAEKCIPQLGLLARQDVFTVSDEGHLDPEARENLGELDADETCANNDDGAWQPVELTGVLTGDVPDSIQPFDGWHRRPRTRGDQKSIGGDATAAGLHRIAIQELPPLLDQRDPLIPEVLFAVSTTDPVDDLIHVGTHRRPVDGDP